MLLGVSKLTRTYESDRQKVKDTAFCKRIHKSQVDPINPIDLTLQFTRFSRTDCEKVLLNQAFVLVTRVIDMARDN